MHLVKITLACLGCIVLALSEDSISSDTAAVCQHDPSQCNCSASEEFENLQNNLDNCLHQNENKSTEFEEHIKACERGNEQLKKSIDDKDLMESQWKQEKSEMQAMISKLNDTIDTKSKEAEFINKQNDDLHAKLQALESKIKSMNDEEEEAVLIKQTLSETESKLDQCLKTHDENSTKYEQTLKRLEDLESKQSKITLKHDKKVKDLRTQISKMKSDLENQKRVTRSTQDRFHDTSERLTDVDRELRMMHIRAQTTYFNTTLVKEDTMNFIFKNVEKAMVLVEDFVFNRRNQELYYKVKDTMMTVIDPLLPLFDDLVYPKLILVEQKVKELDTVEGTRRLMISILENLATVSINYIELSKSHKAGTRRIQTKAMRILRNTKDDAEYLVDVSMRLLMLYLGYKMLAIGYGMFSSLFGRKTKSSIEK